MWKNEYILKESSKIVLNLLIRMFILPTYLHSLSKVYLKVRPIGSYHGGAVGIVVE